MLLNLAQIVDPDTRGLALLLLAAAAGLMGLLLVWALFAMWRRHNKLNRMPRREKPGDPPDAWKVSGERLMARMDQQSEEDEP
jgi:hypothetical protein